MDVSIIIVNYNTKQVTQSCINSIVEHSHGFSYEIILVDNHSTDGSYALFSNDARIKYVYNEKNVGFGQANNIGYQYSTGDFIFLLNSDTVLRNDPFSYFFEFLHRRENIGALGAYLKDGNRVYTKSGGNFYSMSKYLMMGVKRFFFVPSNEEIPLSNDSCKVEYVIGADLFIRKELFEDCLLYTSPSPRD